MLTGPFPYTCFDNDRISARRGDRSRLRGGDGVLEPGVHPGGPHRRVVDGDSVRRFDPARAYEAAGQAFSWAATITLPYRSAKCREALSASCVSAHVRTPWSVRRERTAARSSV